MIKNMATGTYDELDILKNAFKFWIPVKICLGTLALVSANEK